MHFFSQSFISFFYEKADYLANITKKKIICAMDAFSVSLIFLIEKMTCLIK